MKLYSNLKKQLKLEISWLNYPYLFFIYLVHVIDYILLALIDKNSSFIKLSILTFFGNVLIDKLIIAYQVHSQSYFRGMPRKDLFQNFKKDSSLSIKL